MQPAVRHAGEERRPNEKCGQRCRQRRVSGAKEPPVPGQEQRPDEKSERSDERLERPSDHQDRKERNTPGTGQVEGKVRENEHQAARAAYENAESGQAHLDPTRQYTKCGAAHPFKTGAVSSRSASASVVVSVPTGHTDT